MPLITNAIIEAGMSENGALSHAQCRAIGIPLPLVRGWRRRALKSEVTQDQIDQFLALRNVHLAVPNVPRLGELKVLAVEVANAVCAMFEKKKAGLTPKQARYVVNMATKAIVRRLYGDPVAVPSEAHKEKLAALLKKPRLK